MTIIVTYFQTPDLIKICLDQINKHSSSLLKRVILVDNGSADGVAASHQSRLVDVLELPINFGHAWAMDWASWNVDTEYLVTLDSDAWPVRDDWLEGLVGSLEGGASAVGIKHPRGYVHPSCLAVRTALLRDLGVSFQENYPPAHLPPDDEAWGKSFWDVGERISIELRRRQLPYELLEPDEEPGSRPRKYVGSVYGGIVYHNWYGTRVTAEDRSGSFDAIPRREIERELRRWTGSRSTTSTREVDAE